MPENVTKEVRINRLAGDRECGLRDAEDPAIHRSRRTYMRWALNRIRSDRDHPLRFLLSPRENTKGLLVDEHDKQLPKSAQPVLWWNQFTRRSRTGRLQRGRYAVPWDLVPSKHSRDDRKFTVQAGHRLARKSRSVEQFMLEDADANHVDGYMIEGKGAVSRKQTVLIGGIMVDVASARAWAAAGQLSEVRPQDLAFMEKFEAPQLPSHRSK